MRPRPRGSRTRSRKSPAWHVGARKAALFQRPSADTPGRHANLAAPFLMSGKSSKVVVKQWTDSDGWMYVCAVCLSARLPACLRAPSSLPNGPMPPHPGPHPIASHRAWHFLELPSPVPSRPSVHPSAVAARPSGLSQVKCPRQRLRQAARAEASVSARSACLRDCTAVPFVFPCFLKDGWFARSLALLLVTKEIRNNEAH